MNALISKESAVALMGTASTVAIGCGLTKALLQPEENSSKAFYVVGGSVVALIVTANLSKGNTAICALASTFFIGVGMGFAPFPSCLEGRSWSLAGAGLAGIAACVAIQTLFGN